MRKFLLGAAIGLALAASAFAQDKLIYPRNVVPPDAPATPRATGVSGSLLFLAIGAAAAGGWLLWRQRRGPAGFAGRESRKLAVAESRALGNRQYLVVADYDGRKFLIGVCPGRIDMLAPLDCPPASTRVP
jgi:flagellar protein FliO/FliZ